MTKALHPDIAHLTDEEIKSKHSEKRQVAKAAGFAIQYGGTGYTISKNLGISEEEGDAVYNAYFKAFPQLKKYFDETIKESMGKGFVEIDHITRRKFFFKDMEILSKLKAEKLWKKYSKLRGKYERACLNYVIQGTAGSITKFAAILFRKWILNNKLENKVFVTNLVHDEINVECLEDLSEKVAEELEICMKKAGAKWCKIVPLAADAVITDYWTH